MATSLLKIHRQVRGYEQKEIAEVLGISQNTYSRLERNPDSITGEQAKKLSEFYNVDIKDLVTEATPVITFKDSVKENNIGGNGYVRTYTNNFHEQEIAELKKEVEYLRTQNMELIKALTEKKQQPLSD